MDKKNLSDKFHQNLCAGNINASQLRALGETLSLVRDDLPRDSAAAIGDLIKQLAEDLLHAITGMEEVQMETTQAA